MSFMAFIFVTIVSSTLGMAITTISEGSISCNVATTDDAKSNQSSPSPTDSSSTFYNPKRRIGRDFSVLSVAEYLVQKKSSRVGPVRVLDAMSASGMQGEGVAKPVTSMCAFG